MKARNQKPPPQSWMRAAPADADPIFAAIERHRRAHQALGEACRLTDEMGAAQAYETRWRKANKAEERALEALASPTTPAGARAVFAYIRARGPVRLWELVKWDDFLEALIKSPALADVAEPPGEIGLLYGSRAIARFCNLTKAQAKALIRARKLPTFELGGVTCARKSVILQKIEQLEAGHGERA